MDVQVKWSGDVKFTGKTSLGHEVLMDGPPQYGGDDGGPRPMEMVLLGLGGCASFDVVHFLKKARQDVTSCDVQITAERSDIPPSVFEKIHLHFELTGNNLSSSVVERMVRLSAEKYCSASIMLARSGAEITHSFKILQMQLTENK